MSSISGAKCKYRPPIPNMKNNYYLTPVKKKPSNTTISTTQSEDKPIDLRPSSYFTNPSKLKISQIPFILKKQSKANNELMDGSKESIALTQSKEDISTLIPLFKREASNNTNPILAAQSSMNYLLTTPSKYSTDKKLDRCESSTMNKALVQLLVRNESYNLLINKEQAPGNRKLNNKTHIHQNKDNDKETTPIKSMKPIESSPNIRKCSSSKLFPKRTTANIEKESLTNNQMIITTDDLLLIEDKLQDILNNIQNGYTISKECFEWWTFYFSSTIAGNYEEYFYNTKNKKKIRSYVNIELLSLMMCYSLSYNDALYGKYLNSFKTILSFLHFNLLLIIKFIMTIQKVHDYSYIKLDMMIKKSLTTIQEKDIDEFFISSLVDHNALEIGKVYLQILSKEFQSEKDKSLKSFLTYAYDNRESIAVDEFDEYFRFNMIHCTNLEGSVLASSIIKEHSIPVKLKVPYLPIMVYCKYTLVLDLDETLVHYKDNNGGYSKDSKDQWLFRPGLFQFLQKMKNRFEIIVFTVGTKQYADTILNIIETKEKYFDHRLYRNHTTIVNNDFVKDLSKLGRDMSRMIIIDNMPQNYRLQKENGIFIKPYIGENKNDTALIHLCEILYKIVNDNGDVRKGIVKYKDDILERVSLNKVD